MSRRVVIFNVFGHRNTGDAMLLETLLDLLMVNHDRTEIEGIAFDPSSERQWMPEILWHERIGNKKGRGISGRIRQAAALAVAIAIATSRSFLPLRHLLPKDQRSAIEALDGADVAISCPGGYLEDSNYAYVLNLLQMLLARRLAKKTILAPQSIGPIQSKAGRASVALSLRRMDAIYVREEVSQKFLKELIPTSSALIHSAGDLAFWYSRRRDAGLKAEWARLGVDQTRPIFGLTVVEWNFPHHSDSKTAQEAYLNSLSMLIDRMISSGRQVVLFNQVSSDLPWARSLANRNSGVILDQFERDSGLFAAMIAQCEFFVGSRFHSCIFALLGAVPTIAIAYLPKTDGIMKGLGLAEFVIPIDEITPGALLEKFELLESRRAGVSKALKVGVAEYRTTNGQFVEDLVRLGEMSNR